MKERERERGRKEDKSTEESGWSCYHHRPYQLEQQLEPGPTRTNQEIYHVMDLHMSSVAERTDTSLTGALVVTSLQSHVAFTGTELLFGELTFVLFRHFRAQTRTSVLRMFLSLNNHRPFGYFQ